MSLFELGMTEVVLCVLGWRMIEVLNTREKGVDGRLRMMKGGDGSETRSLVAIGIKF